MKDSIVPPISTPIKDEKVRPDKLRFNIEKMNGTGVGGYLVLGSNGETALLTDEERLLIIETARASVASGKVLVAGTGQESTKGTILLTRKAADLGADYALIGNPHYFKGAMTVNNLYDHYVAVAEASSIPIIPYNSPGFTGINMGPELVGKLSQHPNVVGIKDGTGNIAQLAEFRSLGGPDFLIFTGNAPTFLPALFVGISGGMMPITNIYPDLWISVLRAFRNGDVEKARRLETILLPMTKTIMKYGPGGIKAAMDVLGLYGGPPLLPLKSPPAGGIEEIRGALRQVENQIRV
ncbi:MAG: dihydrodipicolinate synthase family protein [Syntrophaceae bacterium]|nr:dihydrodipicolinate synthase family protein [Syntrophaceae bacterium]